MSAGHFSFESPFLVSFSIGFNALLRISPPVHIQTTLLFLFESENKCITKCSKLASTLKQGTFFAGKNVQFECENLFLDEKCNAFKVHVYIKCSYHISGALNLPNFHQPFFELCECFIFELSGF